jgi:predicted nicotinamide N-methyase
MQDPLVFTIPQPFQQDGGNLHGQTTSSADCPDLKIRLHQIDDEDDADDDEQQEQQRCISHDVGFVMWPASIVLARWLAENPAVVLKNRRGWSNQMHNGDVGKQQHQRILELGAGCGLVGLTVAAMLHQDFHQRRHQQSESRGSVSETDNDDLGAFKDHDDSSTATSSYLPSQLPSVVLTDYNPKVLENLRKNLVLNDLSDFGSVAGLDFFDQPGNSNNNDDGIFDFGAHNNDITADVELSNDNPNEEHEEKVVDGWFDMNGRHHPQVDLILAADILCYSNDATMVANTLQASLLEGGKAILVSADETVRFGAAAFPDACLQAVLRFSNIETFPHPLARDADDDVDVDPQNLKANLIMFTVEKPFTATAPKVKSSRLAKITK